MIRLTQAAVPKRILLLFLSTISFIASFAIDVTVTDFGAAGDGTTLNTEAIQKAIDACSSQGGGKVVFPAGNWVSGTILLKNGVTLHLQQNAVLIGSTNISHYQLVDEFKDGKGYSMGYCLIGAIDVKNTGITGQGKINGNGRLLLEKHGNSKRPFLVRFVRCTNVNVTDVYMEGPAAWTMHFFECSNVLAERVVIRSRGLSNNDGIDVDCCEKVLIKDCDIDSGDDALCLKATGPKPCRNIEISNCIINTNQGAFKMGTESVGDFENIYVHDLTVKNTKGIKLFSVDGSQLKHLVIENISIENATLPLLLRLGSRLKTFREGDAKRPTGIMEDVRIRNIKVKQATQMAVLISGVPGYLIKDVQITNIKVSLPGGGKAEDAQVVFKEHEAAYPEVNMFGNTMPCYGIYMRHANGLKLSNIKIDLEKPDGRPVFTGIDIENIELENWKLPANNSNEAFIKLEEAKNIKLSAIKPSGKPSLFLEVAGSNSKSILLQAKKPQIKFIKGAVKSSVIVK